MASAPPTIQKTTAMAPKLAEVAVRRASLTPPPGLPVVIRGSGGGGGPQLLLPTSTRRSSSGSAQMEPLVAAVSSGSALMQQPVATRRNQGGKGVPILPMPPYHDSRLARNSRGGSWSGMRLSAHRLHRLWASQSGQRATMAYQTEVIIDSQPQGAGTSYTFSGQQGSWNSDLCDCCSDVGLCLCATFVPCILACRVAEQAGECYCLPCLPGTLIALRTGVRERYHIEGSVCDDWVVMSCCPLCGLCQLSRQLNRD